jgi:hypothetical protein
MTKEDWLVWKSDPITKMFYEACEERIEDAKELLVNSAGLEPTQDNFYRGFVYAYREMQDFRVEDEEQNV